MSTTTRPPTTTAAQLEPVKKQCPVYPPIHLTDTIILQKTDEAYLKDLVKFWMDGGMTNLSISLKCPVAKTRMKMPCRGKDCTHIQCFDGATFLKMNERQFGKWLCNICEKPSPLNKLFVDGLLLDILKTVQDDVENIYFDKNGNWSSHDPAEKDSKLDYSIIDLSDTLDVIDLTGSDDESKLESPEKKKEPPKKSKETNSKSDKVIKENNEKENTITVVLPDPKPHSYPLRSSSLCQHHKKSRAPPIPYARKVNNVTLRSGNGKDNSFNRSTLARRPLHQTWHHNQVFFPPKTSGVSEEFCLTGNFHGLDMGQFSVNFPRFQFKAFIVGNGAS